MGIVSAFRQGHGIQVNEDLGGGTIDCRFIEPEDERWLGAVALLPPEDQEPVSPAAPGLERTRADAITGVNRVIGQVRSRFITVIPGQDNIYAAKETEARAFVAGERALEACPFLIAEIGITAPDAYQLAQLWLNMSEQWRQMGSALEGLRIGSIGAITTAQDVETINYVVQMFAAQLNQIPG